MMFWYMIIQVHCREQSNAANLIILKTNLASETLFPRVNQP